MIGKWDTKRHPTPRSRPKPNVVTECWARIGRCFKTIANFRKDNGPAIRAVCRQFIVLCRKLDLFTQALVAIDGSKFKAANNRDKNFTAAKLKRRLAEIDASIGRTPLDLKSLVKKVHVGDWDVRWMQRSRPAGRVALPFGIRGAR